MKNKRNSGNEQRWANWPCRPSRLVLAVLAGIGLWNPPVARAQSASPTHSVTTTQLGPHITLTAVDGTVAPQKTPEIPSVQKDVKPATAQEPVKFNFYDDWFEPNNTPFEAVQIEAGQYLLEGWDEDWFVFEVPAESNITIAVEATYGDLDLFLFDANGYELAESTDYGSYEQVWGTVGAGLYMMAVVPYENQGATYVLTLDIPQTPDIPDVPDNPEPLPPNPGSANRHALLVGIDHYDTYYGPSSLPSCINDAKGARDVLLAGTPAENVQLLTDAQATKSAIRGGLQAIASRSGPDDLIVYFHSSHGGQQWGTSTYLCTYDADYTDAELASDLALFRSTQAVVVIVDACHSGGLFKDAGWPFIERVMKTYKVRKTAQLTAKGAHIPKDLGANIAFMTACNYTETCSAGDVYSLYTEYLVKACSLPSLDGNGDGNYQFSEVHAYAAAEATNQNPNQTAQCYNQALLESRIATAVGAAGGSPSPVTNGLSTEDQALGLSGALPCGAGAGQAMALGFVGLFCFAAPGRWRRVHPPRCTTEESAFCEK